MLSGRTNGWDAVTGLRQEMNRLLGEFLPESVNTSFGVGRPVGFPTLNVWEGSEDLYVEAELPGLSMNELEITVVGNELSIRGERKAEHREKGTYHRRERGVGAFSRVLRLPVDVDAEKVEATLRHGVLEVRLPKAAAARPRRIEVKSVSK